MVSDDPGERLTLPEVHDRHAPFVWRTLQRLGVRNADLEDAMQEVFVVVHKKLSSFRGAAHLTTWLYGISVRVAWSYRRRARRRREEPISDRDAEQPAPVDGEPEALAIRREGRRRLAAVLDAMDPEKRAVLVMFEIEHLETPAIARELGIPLGTVYSRLHAARRQFVRIAARHRRTDRP